MRGELEAGTHTLEQLDAERLLERLDLVADRAMGDMELGSRLAERGVPGRRLESAQGIERWQASRAVHTLYVSFPHSERYNNIN